VLPPLGHALTRYPNAANAWVAVTAGLRTERTRPPKGCRTRSAARPTWPARRVEGPTRERSAAVALPANPAFFRAESRASMESMKRPRPRTGAPGPGTPARARTVMSWPVGPIALPVEQLQPSPCRKGNRAGDLVHPLRGRRGRRRTGPHRDPHLAGLEVLDLGVVGSGGRVVRRADYDRTHGLGWTERSLEVVLHDEAGCGRVRVVRHIPRDGTRGGPGEIDRDSVSSPAYDISNGLSHMEGGRAQVPTASP